MSEFRGSFFRQSQTDYCARTAEPAQKGCDDHNPPGSMFRTEQTLHIYGTIRSTYSHSAPQAAPTPDVVSSAPAPQIETPEEPTTPTYQASEFLSFDLSHLTSRRLCVLGAIRLLDRAAEIGETDGVTNRQMRPYSKNAHGALSRFDRTIKPKGPFSFLR